MKYGLGRFGEQVADLVRSEVLAAGQCFPVLLGGCCESPIEELLIFAVKFTAHFDRSRFSFQQIMIITPGSDVFFHRVPEHEGHLLVGVQVGLATVGGWRVDFLFCAHSPDGWRQLIVECDGHDFHERTKEQAARDRSRDRQAQTAGFEVFRFTGSEIWSDPMGCARQILDWADGVR